MFQNLFYNRNFVIKGNCHSSHFKSVNIQKTVLFSKMRSNSTEAASLGFPLDPVTTSG